MMNLAELKTIARSLHESDKAATLCTHFKNKIIIKNERMYVFDNMTRAYTSKHYKEDILAIAVVKLLDDSFKNLTRNEADKLKTGFEKSYAKIFKIKDVKTYIPLLKELLTNDDIKFDKYLYEVHFKNGCYNTLTKEFKKRKYGKHYITKYINRLYLPSEASHRKIVMDLLGKIVPNKNDLRTILLIFASALSGKAIEDQDILMLTGTGSGGKSTLLTIFSLALPIYFKELKDDAFSMSNAKVDKIMNSFADDPQFRITWINEPKETRFDDSLLKTFCDGKLQTTRLYTDGSHTIEHNSKAILTAQSWPNVKMDSGIARRLKGYETVSMFTEDPTKVDESKHIYLKDKGVLQNFGRDESLQNAYCDILFELCHSWLKGEKIQYSEAFANAKNAMVSANDYIQDFLDSRFAITGKETDRIGKNQMEAYFKETYPNRHLTVLQIISSLKDRGIKYNCDWRIHNVKGCFYGLRPFDDDDKSDDDTSDDDYDHGIEKTNPKDREIQLLKLEVQKLREKLNLYEKQTMKEEAPKKKQKEEHVKDNDEFPVQFRQNITLLFQTEKQPNIVSKKTINKCFTIDFS
jgi:energy-coupling factor transporter ATP-binding protein EcfA2